VPEVPRPSQVEVGRASVPANMTLDTLLGELPDEPVDMAGWDHLVAEGDRERLERLNALFESQQACDVVLRHNGPEALRHVLMRVAQASSAHRVPMSPRVREVAGYYGFAVS